MDPFQAAAQALVRAPGVSVMVSYRPGGRGVPFDIPAIFDQADDSAGGSRGRTLRRRRIVVARADLGATGEPERDDLVGFQDEGGWSVANVEADSSGASYTLTLTRQD
jgi:hypothetical protein